MFKPKARGVAKVRRLIPVQIAQQPGHSQFGHFVDFRACSGADLGGAAIASITCRALLLGAVGHTMNLFVCLSVCHID